MKLSKHFTLEEFVKSGTALERGIDNTPGIVEIVNLCAICHNVLEPIRKQFGPVIITSGYRNFELNRALGSKDTSQHILGEAADFEVPGVPNETVFDWVVTTIEFDMAILEYYTGGNSGWIHCSFTMAENRNKALVFDGNKYRKYNHRKMDADS